MFLRVHESYSRSITQWAVVNNVLVLEACTPTLVGNGDHMELFSPEAHVYELVQAITPQDATEQAHIADVLAWIKSGAPLYRIEKPDKPPKHLVSYFVVVDPEHQSLLLADHIKAQLWLPSGGHVEPQEDPKLTVQREVQEELGIEAIFLRGNDKPFFCHR